MTTALSDGLVPVLSRHVGAQRWYGGAPDDAIELARLTTLAAPWPGLFQAIVRAPAGERYQVVLGAYPAERHVEQPLGTTESADGDAVWVDAATDPELALRLLRVVAPGEEASTARPIGVEQSNTSIVYDERLILKLFRRLSGRNPEVEVTSALGRAGFSQVAAPVAVWTDGEDDFAVLQTFLAGGAEGWALALTSLRALLDEGGEPAESGADFAPEAARLGDTTARMHLALAAAFGAEPGDAARWAEAMVERAQGVDLDGIDGDAVRKAFLRVEAIGDAGSSLRLHGDYHLGQVMLTDQGWFVLDFEGEPTRPVAERRQRSSPLRDVAGMLRSFAYAAGVAAAERPEGRDAAAAWEARNRQTFLERYFDALHGSPIVPGDRATALALLTAFELDKAVYEVAYEAAHRPDWVPIPLGAVRRLAGAA